MPLMGNIHLLERRRFSWLQEHQSHSISYGERYGGRWRAVAEVCGLRLP